MTSGLAVIVPAMQEYRHAKKLRALETAAHASAREYTTHDRKEDDFLQQAETATKGLLRMFEMQREVKQRRNAVVTGLVAKVIETAKPDPPDAE